MVGAKQLKTLGLSWFRPEPYVQQGCARGTILLRTGVPLVGRLQAGVCTRHYIASHRGASSGAATSEGERRCGLQVPSGVIEAKANVMGEGRERAIDRYLLSRV
jgi:hypothetical protein